jgi:hypothetical protein
MPLFPHIFTTACDASAHADWCDADVMWEDEFLSLVQRAALAMCPQ